MKTRKRILSIFLTLALAAGLLAIAPITAHAATGMATIDVSTLGGADADNSAAITTESQWGYNTTTKFLYLYTTSGSYTLTGTNGNLTVLIVNSDQNVTLDSVGIAAPGDQPAITSNASANNWTLNLVGSSTLVGGSGQFANNSVTNQSWTITSTTGGSLTAASAERGGIILQPNDTLRVTGNAAVTAVTKDGWSNVLLGTGASLLIGDNAKLTLDQSSETVYNYNLTVGKADTATTHKWKLTGATTTDPLTDASIDVTVAPGDTATIEREPIAAPTPTKGIFCTNARWYGAWWHYVLFFLGFGFLWMWF